MREHSIHLPSNGLLGYTPDFIVREWSVNEIRSFFTSQRSAAKTTRFLRGCIVSPSEKECPFDNLAVEDTLVLYVGVRIASMGADYAFKLGCLNQSCRQPIPYAVDLIEDLHSLPLKEESAPTFKVTLPESEKVFELRHLTNKDQQDIDKQNVIRKQKLGVEYDNGFVYTRAKQVVSVNDEPVTTLQAESVITHLGDSDFEAFEQALADNTFGYDLSITIDCPYCGDIRERTIPFNEEFLFRAPKRRTAESDS